MEIRKARAQDAAAIARMVNAHADIGDMLPRPLEEVYDSLRDFFVAVSTPGGDLASGGAAVLGCSSLKVMGEDLAEVRSLVVAPEAKGEGLGKALVEACLAEAASLGIRRVFALTAIPAFFEKLGFERVPRSTFPQKIWKDCFSCKYFEACSEVAVQRTTEDFAPGREEYSREADNSRTE